MRTEHVTKMRKCCIHLVRDVVLYGVHILLLYSECTCLHPAWNDPEGVPISAIIFGGRRPEGVPLVIEARSWAQGVLLGAAVKSEATAAAEFKNKEVMHDPMAMRPFFGYNAGLYFQHWLDLEKPGRKV